jgi:SAM-dependent methyltransferase
LGDEPRFRTDLFRGTAEYYDRYRLPYPDVLLDDLRARAGVTGHGRLLDLACGTGQLAFPLAADFDEVWAVDQEPEFVELVAAKAARLGHARIHALAASAEDAGLDPPFELVTIGNAFHRLRRNQVAERAMSWLQPGGCIALVWSGTPTQGRRTWHRAMDDAFLEWTVRIGAEDRVPAGWDQAMRDDPNEVVLRRAGFEWIGSFEFNVEHRWSVDELVGFVYSTSFLNRGALGAHVDEFEADIRRVLLDARPDGVFVDDVTFAYDLARRP